MADKTSPIQPIVASANAELRVNENFDAASPAMLWGRDARTTGALTWGYVGGRWGGATVPSGTVALTAGATNYVVANRESGAVSASTTTTAWADQVAYVRLYRVTTGASSVTDYEDHRQAIGASAAGASGPVVVPVACSDESTPLTAGAKKVAFRAPLALTLTTVRASLTTAQAGGSILTVDVNVNGGSILGTKLTIDNGERTSTTAAAPAVLAAPAVPDDAEITIDLDQVGDGTAAGLKVYLVGVPA
ncbi:hypothetical protein [Paracidovorax citrulli]|uniref:hypothetical protein n=1 Tax=Paracidovorax citrulli TaxID=80869 RepID=UPI000695D729|nr:hypothetical protein [Paracidovorax citrulli]